MPKSQIIKDIVEDKVPLEQSLNRIFLLAVDTKNAPLAKWAQKELNGYETGEDLPDYRYVRDIELQYNGFNDRAQVKGAPLPPGAISGTTMEKISNVGVYDGLHYIEELAKKPEPTTRDLSFLSQQVSESTRNLLACTSIFQVIPQSFFQSVSASIKNRAVIALTALEKIYGNLDSLSPDISSKLLVIDSYNAMINRVVFNVDFPSVLAERKAWYARLPWHILLPILSALAGAGITAILMNAYG